MKTKTFSFFETPCTSTCRQCIKRLLKALFCASGESHLTGLRDSVNLPISVFNRLVAHQT